MTIQDLMSSREIAFTMWSSNDFTIGDIKNTLSERNETMEEIDSITTELLNR